MNQQHQIRSDVSRRAPLDTGLIRRNVRDAAKEQTSEQYLAQITEEWHKRIDQHVKSLATGMTALCQSALVCICDIKQDLHQMLNDVRS